MEKINCEHKFIDKKIIHKSLLSFEEEIVIYCRKCGKTPQQILTDDPDHKHVFDVKDSYAGEIGLVDFYWWKCRCGAMKKLNIDGHE